MAKRIEANEVIQPDLFANSIKSALEFEQRLESLTGHFKTIVVESQKLAGAGNVGSVEGINNISKAYNNAGASVEGLTKLELELARLREKVAQLLAGERNEVIALEQQVRQLQAAKRAGIDIEQKGIGAYQASVNKLHEVKRAIMDLAVANKLNSQEAKELILNYEKLNKTVRDAEVQVGQHQRNVGNYTKGQKKYNYEMFQMTQILRELPNFAMSARIGIMALSNNIPQLGDAFRNIANDINPDTQKRNGFGFALKQMLKSIVSWQSLMLVGITIAVASADAIGKWASGLFSAKSNVDAVTGTLKRLNDELDESSRKNNDSLAKEITTVNSLVDVMRSSNTTLKEKHEAQEELNKIAPDYLKNITTENVNTQTSIDLIGDYIESLKAKAKAEASYEKMVAKEKQILDLADAQELVGTSKFNQLVKDKDGKGGMFTQDELDNLWKQKYGEYADKYITVSQRVIRKGSVADKSPAMEEFTYKMGDLVLKNMTGGVPAEMQSRLYQFMITDYIDSLTQSLEEDLRVLRSKSTFIPKHKGGTGGKGGTDKGEKEIKLRKDDVLRQIENERQAALKLNEIRTNEILALNDDADERKRIGEKNNRNIMEIDLKYLEHKLRMLRLLKDVDPNDIRQTELEVGVLRSKLLIGDVKKSDKSLSGKTPKEQKAIIDTTLKDTLDSSLKLAQTLDQMLSNDEKRRQDQIGRQVDATKRRQDELKALARLGSKDAQNSLALEEKRQAELERKQDQLARRSQRRQMGIAALNSYSARVGRGDTNATANTIADISTLLGFISALPGFYEGTEHGNIADNLGKPQLKGKDGYIIRVDGSEKVFKGMHSQMIGNMSNQEVAELAYTHRVTGGLNAAKPYNDDVVNELREVKKAIGSIPTIDTAWNEQEKAFQRTIKAGNVTRVELHKTGGLFRS